MAGRRKQPGEFGPPPRGAARKPVLLPTHSRLQHWQPVKSKGNPRLSKRRNATPLGVP